MAVDFPERAVHGGTGKRQREKTREKVLDFSASVNPFPPAFSWHCDPADLAAYPDDSYRALKERIGSIFSRDPEEICVGNGSIEILRVFCQVVLGERNTNRCYYLDEPTFGEYELSARLAGATRARDPASAGVRFICNPNNPTGTVISRSSMLDILDATTRHKGLLFCDEAFIDLADPAASLARTRDPGLFVLQSLTKSFAVPGLRIGFGLGDPRLVDRIETARSPWCVNAYAESFAMEALLHLDDLAASRLAIARERNRLADGLAGLGFGCTSSSANYLLVDCGRDVTPLCDQLLRQNILVRHCGSFGLPAHIRIAVRTPDENARLLEALAACVR